MGINDRSRVWVLSLLVLSLAEVARSDEEPQSAGKSKISAELIHLETKAGKIYGTLDLPAGSGPFPIVIVIAGSGPTDRDGNTVKLGLKNDCLKQLGQGLAAKGIAVLRYDRPGVGKSAGIALKEEDLCFEMLVEDVVGWMKLLRKDRRFARLGIVGHSQGSLVGMLAAKQGKADAFVALAGVGRPAAEVLRWQFAKNLPTKSLKDQGGHIIDELVAGRTVAEVPKGLEDLRLSVQSYLISYFKYDPAKEIAGLQAPVMIVQGTTDLQTPVEEAELLAKGAKGAKLCLIKGMNHVLKATTATAVFGQRATYTDPSIPLAPTLVEEVAAFLHKSLGSLVP
ncbi:MAG: alpha/beta hydrolase family protein [Gemmataceae bacterium]